MTRKEEFLKAYEQAKEKGEVIAVWLYIQMPGGETEVIINPKPEEKVAYIDKTYNDDLVHCNSDKIIIESYEFGTAEDEEKMNFGDALEILKMGGRVARKGWNGKEQYIELASNISYQDQRGEVVNCDHEAIGNQAIAFVGTSGVQMGWLASQADMLAEDWVSLEVPGEEE